MIKVIIFPAKFPRDTLYIIPALLFSLFPGISGSNLGRLYVIAG